MENVEQKPKRERRPRGTVFVESVALAYVKVTTKNLYLQGQLDLLQVKYQLAEELIRHLLPMAEDGATLIESIYGKEHKNKEANEYILTTAKKLIE